MKPILFNSEMVRAILDGRKTVTRRVVKPQPNTKCSHGGEHEFIRDDFIDGSDFTGFICKKCGYGVCWPHFRYPIGTSWIRPPSRPGDTLYVRETFKIDYLSNIPGSGRILYKADGAYSDFSFAPDRYDMMRRAQLKPGWRPNENMPREAARIFLLVTSVRAERLQDITEEQARAEGAEPFMMTVDVDKPDNEKRWVEKLPALVSFPGIWDSTIKPADRTLFGWDANPWVWVIEFERCEKPGEVAAHEDSAG